MQNFAGNFSLNFHPSDQLVQRILLQIIAADNIIFADQIEHTNEVILTVVKVTTDSTNNWTLLLLELFMFLEIFGKPFKELWKSHNEVVFHGVQLTLVDFSDRATQLLVKGFFLEDTQTGHFLDWEEPTEGQELVGFMDN